MSKGGWFQGVLLLIALAAALVWGLYPVGRYQVVVLPGDAMYVRNTLLVDTRTGETWHWSGDDRAWVAMEWRR